MASVASRPHVVEVEPQIRPLLNGHLMVGVQVAFAAIVSAAKFGEHPIDGRVAKVEPAEVRDEIRLPATIHTAPAVAPEAQNP